jgi:hypothetical protein
MLVLGGDLATVKQRLRKHIKALKFERTVVGVELPGKIFGNTSPIWFVSRDLHRQLIEDEAESRVLEARDKRTCGRKSPATASRNVRLFGKWALIVPSRAASLWRGTNPGDVLFEQFEVPPHGWSLVRPFGIGRLLGRQLLPTHEAPQEPQARLRAPYF